MEGKIVDYRLTEIGRQNWDVCHRMIMHDLLDMNIPEVKELLKYYSISYTDNGGYTMALPRKMLPQFQKEVKVKKPKGKKGGRC